MSTRAGEPEAVARLKHVFVSFDINDDAALKNEALRARQNPRHRTQHRSSKDLQHLYYPRQFFTELASEENCSCSIVDDRAVGSK